MAGRCGGSRTSAWHSSVWRNIRALEEVEVLLAPDESSISSSLRRPPGAPDLHLEEVGLGEVLQPVARGVRRELVEVDARVDVGQLVVEQGRVARAEQRSAWAQGARAPARPAQPSSRKRSSARA